MLRRFEVGEQARILLLRVLKDLDLVVNRHGRVAGMADEPEKLRCLRPRMLELADAGVLIVQDARKRGRQLRARALPRQRLGAAEALPLAPEEHVDDGSEHRQDRK